MVPPLLTIFFVLLVAVIYQQYIKYFDSTHCQNDPPISFSTWSGDTLSTASCDLFSDTYVEARDKFRAALTSFENNVEQISITIAMDGGETLTMDVAIFQGNTEKFGTIVHSSGLHGVEGYAGSAIQLALLQEGTLPLQDSDNRPTIVLIHAINPVGMSQYRRCNEHNVDLNRNAIRDFESFLEQRDPNVANYDDFRCFLSPTDEGNAVIPTAWYAKVGIWIALLPKLFEHGFVALKRAMVAGQYHHPQGIFFGGQELQPSLQKLDEELQRYPELFRDAPSLIWIDVHTGLGPFGKDSVHYHQSKLFGNGRSSLPKTAADIKEEFLSTVYSVTSSIAEQETSEAFVGYDVSTGMLTEYLAESFNGSGLFLVQEFGTLPSILVGRGLILDNMLYQQYVRFRKQKEKGNASQQLESILAVDTFAAGDGSYRSPWLKNAFFPQSTLWRTAIVERGVALARQAIKMSKQMTQ